MPRTLRLIAAAGIALALAACGTGDPAALVASAKKYLADANPASAIIQLKSALQKEPDNGEARYLLARAMLDSGDRGGAESEARKALELRYAEDQVVPVLARALLAEQKFPELLAELGTRKLGTPQARADLNASLALAQVATGNAAAGERLAAEAARDAPDDARVLVTQAEVATARGNRAAVAGFIDHALAKEPRDANATMMKAGLLSESGQSDAAAKLLEDAVAASPKSMDLRLTLVRLLVSQRKLDAAGAQVAKLKEQAPDAGATLYADALWSYANKDVAHARDVLQRVMAHPPVPMSAVMLNGLVEFQLGSYGAAEQALRTVLTRLPGEVNARRFLAMTYVRTGRAAQALELVEPTLRAGSTDALLWSTAGEAALVAGNVPAAAEYYERASALDQENVDAKVHLARIRLATGETDRAFRDLESLSRAEPAGAQADLALFSAHMSRREYDKALGAAQTLVQKQPQSAMAYTLLGTVQRARRDDAAARASFEKAIALDPKYVDAARNLAVLDGQDGKFDAARARYEAMLAKDPTSEATLLASAELEAVAGAGPDAARKLLERAVRAQPASPRPRVALVALLMRQGDTKAALATAQEAQAVLPRDLQVAEALGNAQLAAKNANQAIDTFQRIATEQPRNTAALLKVSAAQAAGGDVQNAVITARKAVELQPGYGPAWVQLTQLLQKSDRTDLALVEARKLQAERPREAVGWLLEGEIHASAKQWSAATAAYRQAYARGQQPLIAGRIYIALLRDNKAAEATTFATQWNREHPKDVTLIALAARDAQTRKDYPAAIASYRAAIAIDPENFILLNNYAWVLSLVNDPAAREYAERAYRLAPFNAGVLDTYGAVLAAAGDVGRGLPLLRMATNLSPQDPEMRLHLGKALAKGGDKAGARKELETVARLDPQSPLRSDAEKALAEL